MFIASFLHHIISTIGESDNQGAHSGLDWVQQELRGGPQTIQLLPKNVEHSRWTPWIPKHFLTESRSRVVPLVLTALSGIGQCSNSCLFCVASLPCCWCCGVLLFPWFTIKAPVNCFTIWIIGLNYKTKVPVCPGDTNNPGGRQPEFMCNRWEGINHIV